VSETRRQSRDPLERFDTPSWVTRALIKYGPLPRGLNVIEPMAGANAMTRVLADEGGCTVAAFDIEPRADGITQADTLAPNFFVPLAMTHDGSTISVITNPPFSKAAALWRHAQFFRRTALLVRITWLERTKDRDDVPDPVRVIVLPRPKFTRQGSDSATVVWACWGDWPPGIVRLGHHDRNQLLLPLPASRLLVGAPA